MQKKMNSRSNIVVLKNKLPMSKRSQVTVFIIIAVLVVLGIGIFYYFKGSLFSVSVPSEFAPVYDYYISCIDSETKNGALLLGQGAGYIENPDFKPGSDYMPFSSQLDFLGFGIPYWYYISGNGVSKEQVPSVEKMQEQLDGFVKEGLNYECDFSMFEDQGYVVQLGEAESVNTKINKNSINARVNQNINIYFENSSWTANSHSVDVTSNLGNFYELAKKIYANWEETMFLENYGIDVLRLYAPVDGIEKGCSTKIWRTNDVRKTLMDALEANVPAVKLKGDYYDLAKEENKYFVRDIGENVNANINFMYSRSWPMKMEVWPSEDGLMRADPMGNQEGMEMLGFCYVPYHFVYDFAYPVLIQMYYDSEMFQFPVVVSIVKNKPREGLNASGNPQSVPELCQYKNYNMNVYTIDNALEPVEADISFKCFDTTCTIGKTKLNNGEAVLNGMFPQCVNGFVVAKAEGYRTKKYIITSLTDNNLQIVLNKKYNLELEVSGVGSGEYAIVTFDREGEVTSVAYPEQKSVELTEGQYEIKSYIYSNTNINLKGSTSQKCVQVSKSGFLGFFGSTEEKCFDMQIPDQEIDTGISGGGKESYYIAETELENSKKIIISPDKLKSPSNVEDLQKNYNDAENGGLNIEFE